MEFSYFSRIDPSSSSSESLIQEIKIHQTYAGQLKNRYVLLSRHVPFIDDQDESRQLSSIINDFMIKFKETNADISKKIRGDESQLIEACEDIKSYEELFNSVEPFYQKYKDDLIPLIDLDEQQEFIANQFSRWSNLNKQLLNDINSGLDNILKLKSSLIITNHLKTQIEEEVEKNSKSSDLNFKLFIGAVILIPILLLPTFFIDGEWLDLLLMRLSIALPILWIAKWFSTNYAYAKLGLIKFEHLSRLLGEGAPTIANLVKDDADAVKQVYKHFAELLLDITDIASITIKQPKHPTEEIKEVLDIHKSLKELLNSK